MLGDGRSASPVARRDEPVVVPLMGSDLLERLNKIMEQNEAVLRESAEIRKSVEYCHKSIEELSCRLAGIAADVVALAGQVRSNTEECAQLKTQLKTAMGRVNWLEQAALVGLNSVEIRGVPQKNGEDLDQLVIDVGKSFRLDLTPRDISLAKRAGSKRADQRPLPLLVQFVHRRQRDAFLSGMRVKRALTTRDIGWNDNQVSPIFVGEALSPHNKFLYSKANELRRSGKLRFLWVVDGRILVRRKEGERVVHVTDVEDLKNFQ